MTKKEFLFWEQTTRDTIDVKRIYIDIAGDLVTGILLSQIVYWHLPSKTGGQKLRVKKDGKFWLAKGRDDWWDEVRISAKQFDRAIKELVEKGIVEKRLYKFNGSPTIHIHLNFAALLAYIGSFTGEQSQDHDCPDDQDFIEQENEICPEGKNDISKTVKSNLPKRENRTGEDPPNGKLDFDEKGKSITKNTTQITDNIEHNTETRWSGSVNSLERKLFSELCYLSNERLPELPEVLNVIAGCLEDFTAEQISQSFKNLLNAEWTGKSKYSHMRSLTWFLAINRKSYAISEAKMNIVSWLNRKPEIENKQGDNNESCFANNKRTGGAYAVKHNNSF